MKIVLINGSPRKNGVTNIILKKIKTDLSAFDRRSVIKASRVKLIKALCGLDMGDGSERAEYVCQDYILDKMGRMPRRVSIMFTYYPFDCVNMEISKEGIEIHNKELIIESFREDNFELIINPCFTFFGETLINKIKDYEAPLLSEKEEPIIEEEEELPQMIISSNENNTNIKDNKNIANKNVDKDKKDNKMLKVVETSNTNGENPKKDSPMNTASSNLSGKKEEN